MLFRHAVIKKCRKKDIDSDRPRNEQVWCLYTSDGSRLLGRHPTQQDAYKQESAIKAQSRLHFVADYLERLSEEGQSR